MSAINQDFTLRIHAVDEASAVFSRAKENFDRNMQQLRRTWGNTPQSDSTMSQYREYYGAQEERDQKVVEERQARRRNFFAAQTDARLRKGGIAALESAAGDADSKVGEAMSLANAQLFGRKFDEAVTAGATGGDKTGKGGLKGLRDAMGSPKLLNSVLKFGLIGYGFDLAANAAEKFRTAIDEAASGVKSLREGFTEIARTMPIIGDTMRIMDATFGRVSPQKIVESMKGTAANWFASNTAESGGLQAIYGSRNDIVATTQLSYLKGQEEYSKLKQQEMEARHDAETKSDKPEFAAEKKSLVEKADSLGRQAEAVGIKNARSLEDIERIHQQNMQRIQDEEYAKSMTAKGQQYEGEQMLAKKRSEDDLANLKVRYDRAMKGASPSETPKIQDQFNSERNAINLRTKNELNASEASLHERRSKEADDRVKEWDANRSRERQQAKEQEQMANSLGEQVRKFMGTDEQSRRQRAMFAPDGFATSMESRVMQGTSGATTPAAETAKGIKELVADGKQLAKKIGDQVSDAIEKKFGKVDGLTVFHVLTGF